MEGAAGSPVDARSGKDRDTVNFVFSGELSSRLIKLSAASDIRLHIVLTAVLVLLLGKYTGNDDIVTASPILKPDAHHDNSESLINKVLILRNSLTGRMNFKELLFQVRETLVEADEHRDYPLEVLLKQLNLAAPPFNVALLLENIHDREYLSFVEPEVIFSFLRSGNSISGQLEYSVSSYKKETIERIAGHFRRLSEVVLAGPEIQAAEVEFLLPEEKRQLLVDFNRPEKEYPVDKTIHGLFERQSVENPDNIAVVGIPGAGTKNYKLQNTNYKAPGRGGPSGITNHKSQITNVALTYRQLNEKADSLAAVLIGKGVKTGAIVGLMVERSTEMIVGILGILKAGAAFLPINPKNPPSRTVYMLRDCSAGLLLTTGNLFKEASGLSDWPGETVFIDARVESQVQAPVEVKVEGGKGTNSLTHLSSLAYVVYTSGSTGNPKGVPITHGNFCPLMFWGYSHLGLGPEDRVIRNLPYYFDWSVWEIFIALTSGSELYMIGEDILLNPGAEIDFILKNKITVLHITPTQHRYLINVGRKLDTLKYLCLGAEKLTHDLLIRSLALVNEECRIFNMYGPTEATVIAAVLEIDRQGAGNYEELSSVPIGKTTANTALLVLDKSMKLCPIGVTGELYIAGDALARGYLNNPELTAEKFLSLSFEQDRSNRSYKTGEGAAHPPSKLLNERPSKSTAPQSPTTLYRTGDRVRRLPDGTLEFSGRVDFQVKIRGYRIEPGEIENRLLHHPQVKEALVLVRQYENGENYLCAYIVAQSDDFDIEKGDRQISEKGEKGDRQIIPQNTEETQGLSSQGFGGASSISVLRDYLSVQLPDYMVPSYFVFIERMPLNPNGKMDIDALPHPQPRETQGKNTYVTPRTELEKVISETWKEVLEVERVGINDNFFDLGGNSLKIVKINTLLEERLKEMNKDVPALSIFSYPTIAEMTRHLEECGAGEETAALPAAEPAVERADVISNGRSRLRSRLRKSKND